MLLQNCEASNVLVDTNRHMFASCSWVFYRWNEQRRDPYSDLDADTDADARTLPDAHLCHRNRGQCVR